MALNTGRLGPGTLSALPPPARPAVQPGDLRPGIVHLGLGAFHRAHQAVYTEEAVAAGGGDWGIVGVASRSRTVYDALMEQGGLYSVLTVGGAEPQIRTVGVLAGLRHAASNPGAVVAALADPAIRVITLTVTEKAYRLDGTGKLLVDDALRAELTGAAPPASVPAQLLHGLLARERAGAGPVAVLCCDNLAAGGRRLAGLVRQAAAVIGRETPAGVAFPSAMVDRIVPATDAGHVERARALLGLTDEVPVVAEPFRQWVIEDDFPGGRPPWEHAGVTMTDDVAPWEAVKLRVLNAVHSALAYLGALAGQETIAGALALPGMRDVLRRLIAEDIAPSLTPPAGVDVVAYGDTVLTRFANAELGHRTLQVAMDGTQKLPYRLLGTVLDRRRAGALPELAVLVLAAWMRFVRGYADDGSRLPLDDPMAAQIEAALRAAPDTPDGVVRALCGLTEVIPPELGEDEELRAALAGRLRELERYGAAATVRPGS